MYPRSEEQEKKTRVQQYLELKRLQADNENFISKESLLIQEGLYEEVYSDSREEPGYPEYNCKLDKYYKKVPLECSDEEFQEILKYAVANQKSVARSAIAIMFKSIAVAVYVIGFMAGIGAYIEDFPIPMFKTWLTAFLAGTACLGFGEIINLLYKISKK